MSKPTLGFVGLGRMGTPMTSRLLAAGHAVTVFDPVSSAVQALVSKGATAAASPREVANSADIVFASLPTPDVVRKVALDDDGVVRGTRARIFVDLSTTGPRVSAQVGEALAQANRPIVMVDCPVSGGVAGAREVGAGRPGRATQRGQVDPAQRPAGQKLRSSRTSPRPPARLSGGCCTGPTARPSWSTPPVSTSPAPCSASG